MRTLLFSILMLAVFFYSCTQRSNSALSEEQKNSIHEEIQLVIGQIRDATAHVDTTKLYDAFSFADNDFTYIETNGSFYDQAAYKQMVRDFYGPLESEIIERGDEKFSYLNENNVLWSYSGSLTVDYKDRRREAYEPFGMTMLFRKTNNKWKVVFLQESTQAPTPIQPPLTN